MGVISRKVLPACGSLCFVCPSLRSRSRQPVKRYKKLLVNSFPRSQAGDPDERMVSKLCEYASKNPMRVPKITQYLDKRFNKELQSERVGFVRVVPFIYTKLLRSCKEQMPLYAPGILAMIKTLLEQTQQDELRILGSRTLMDFLDLQTESTYTSNLEGLVPKLCQLAREVGDDERGLSLRAAGLQSLVSMLHFCSKNSHLPTNIDDIVSATLYNFEIPKENSNQNKLDESQVAQVSPVVESVSPTPESDLEIKPDNLMNYSKNPTYLSRLCLHNMAVLAKEAATTRRILDHFLQHFDSGSHWSSERGIAFSVLCEMALFMESGQNIHQLLAMLVKHLDHRNVSQKPSVQVRIVEIASYLAMQTKALSSVTATATICEVMRQLRKHMQCCFDSLDTADEKGNPGLYSALDDFLLNLMKKVGDFETILDMMAMFLENIPTAPTGSRPTIVVVYRSALALASIHCAPSHHREFPESLFHQLLLAMSHGDLETRVASYRVFSSVLVPELNCPWSIPLSYFKIKGSDPAFMAQMAFSSSEVILENVRESKYTDVLDLKGNETKVPSLSHLEELRGQHHKSDAVQLPSSTEIAEKIGTIRLSSHQVDRLLLLIWVQATSPQNNLSCYEAMAHAFGLSVICAESITSSWGELVRCFQLGFSLRCLSLDEGCALRPSHRRSLFTLASFMLIFSANACGNTQLASSIKESSDGMIDPHLHLMEYGRLEEPVPSRYEQRRVKYGSDEDDSAAQQSLLIPSRDVEHLKRMVALHFERSKRLTQEELTSISQQLSQSFTAEDVILLGTPRLSDPLTGKELQPMEKIMPVATLEDEETSHDESGQAGNHTPNDILSADQLIQSVLETARQVATHPVPSEDVPYAEMKKQSEALEAGKQQKISTLLTYQGSVEDSPTINGATRTSISKHKAKAKSEDIRTDNGDCYSSFRLPPSSPFDKFLRAAGIAEQGSVHAQY